MNRKICLVLSALILVSCGKASGKTMLSPTTDGRLHLSCDDTLPNSITVSVVPENTDVSSLVPADGMKNILIKTVEKDALGKFEFKADLSQSFDNGKYIVRTYSDKLDCTNAYALAAGMNIGGINAAKSAAQLGAALENISGFETENLGKFVDGALKYMLAVRPNGGFDNSGFISAFMMGEATAKMNGGDISLGDALVYYSAYTDVDATVYDSLGDRQKKAADDIAKNTEYNAVFSSKFDGLITAAKIKGAQSFETLQSEYLAYAAKNGVSLADYNSLDTDYKRDTVFMNMHTSLGNTHSQSDIDALFASCVATVKNSGSQTGGGGGSSSGGGSSGGGTTYLPPSYDAESASPFSDMTNHWAKDYVSVLKTKGAANGYGDGTFRPDESVTRAEFVKMIVSICSVADSDEAVFDDVTGDKWYFGAVSGAYKSGIVGGVGQGRFAPESHISRQDAAVIINRIKNYSGDGAKVFSDAGFIADYALKSVAALSGVGIINGYEDGTFRPEMPVTRGECAAMLAKAFYADSLQR